MRRIPRPIVPDIIVPGDERPGGGGDDSGDGGPIIPTATSVGLAGPSFLSFVETRPRETVLDEVLRQAGRGTGRRAIDRAIGILGRLGGIAGVVITGAIITRDVILERQRRRIDEEVAAREAEFQKRLDEIKARILRRGRVEVLPSPRPGIDSPAQTPVIEPRVLPTPEPAAQPVRTRPETRPPAPVEIPTERRPIIEIPTPTPAPPTEVAPDVIEIPVPTRSPATQPLPRPTTRPARRPGPLPGLPRIFPRALPRPSVRVRPRVRTRSRPTVARPTLRPDAFASPRLDPSPFAQPRSRAPECPPCQRVKEKRRVRGECEEGFFREFADETQFTTWRVRNCATGGKLKEEERLPFGLGDFEVQL